MESRDWRGFCDGARVNLFGKTAQEPRFPLTHRLFGEPDSAGDFRWTKAFDEDQPKNLLVYLVQAIELLTHCEMQFLTEDGRIQLEFDFIAHGEGGVPRLPAKGLSEQRSRNAQYKALQGLWIAKLSSTQGEQSRHQCFLYELFQEFQSVSAGAEEGGQTRQEVRNKLPFQLCGAGQNSFRNSY